MRTMVSLAATLGTVTGVMTAQGSHLGPQSAVPVLRHEWNTAMTMRDTARLGYLLTDDAVVLSDDVRLNGRTEVITSYAQRFAAFGDYRLALTTTDLLPPNPVGTDSIASEYGTWREIFTGAGGTVVQSGTFYDIWRRGPDGWRIAAHAFATTSCAGDPSYCRGR